MSGAAEAVLQRRPAYAGETWTVTRLQDEVHKLRDEQNRAVADLEGLRARSQSVAVTLDAEMKKLAALAQELVRRRRLGDSKGFFAWLGKLAGQDALTRGSLEALLKEQYAVACLRVRESADTADRLRKVEQDLRRELEQLNQRISDAAHNREQAQAYVAELRALIAAREADLSRSADPETAAHKRLVGAVDTAKNLLAEHERNGVLFGSAVERLERLRESTSALATLVGALYTDIARYVEAASFQLDQASTQIQAVGAAADAAVVLLELRRSVDLLGQSLRQASRFVSETQLYFREHLDGLIEDLAIYDRQTLAVLEENRREAEAHAEIARELGS